MFGALVNGASKFVIGVGKFFTSEGEESYIQDCREVMVHGEKKCKFPKNYKQIVGSGSIREKKDTRWNVIKDENGNPVYELLYGGNVYNLAFMTKAGNKSYFTIEFPKLNKSTDNYEEFYKPFGFSRFDLRTHTPVFEVDTSTNPPKLVGSDKKDGKGRNGEQLYTTRYKWGVTRMMQIIDHEGNLEIDKSLISVPLVFASVLVKKIVNGLTYLPMKLGEYLIEKENPIAKFFGYVLFTPAAIVKGAVNIVAAIIRFPILLFVADKEKYADSYFTQFNHQLKECWKEIKSDCGVIVNGKRADLKDEENPKLKDKRYPEASISGTWDELNDQRKEAKKDLKKWVNKHKVSSETISPVSPGKGGKAASETLKPNLQQGAKVSRSDPQQGTESFVNRTGGGQNGPRGHRRL
ncbi:hypothetical protein [Wolbachia endosymbiont of Ctenocephalides felis wCfeT]|uniref:hypothetical protein n=1 Tax=Wolbachia endosymbiont of Ctenocephalides felis wCfeT TaxID=2732593 RepID=UPI001444E15C|nr:hypothetical protein [Wolbachia endosymbiont of Ctenocephalides felis wCfeT]